jgi:hypothetical protein
MATSVSLGLDPLFLAASSVSYSADEFRALNELLGTGGVRSSTDFVVSGSGTTVTITKGTALVRDATADTVYVCRRTASTSLDITNGLGMTAGQSRIDLIVLQVLDATVIGGVTNDAVLKVVAGTPATSPTAPALPRAAIELGRVVVNAGQGSLTSATFTATVSEHPGTVNRYVSVAGSQTVQGNKNFTGGIQASNMKWGSSVVTTDANGFVTVPHGMGQVPSVVLAVWGNALGGGPSGLLGTDTYTATAFRTRLGNGGNVTIRINWLALA